MNDIVAELRPGISVASSGAILVDPDIVYPEILDALGVSGTELDQYWLEVAYQCAKLEVARVLVDSGHDPWPARPRAIVIQSRKGAEEGDPGWVIANYPVGRGADAATKGREAREHYRRWRGFVPA